MIQIVKITAAVIATPFVILAVWWLAIVCFGIHPPEVPRSVKNVNDMESFMEELTASGVPPGASIVVLKNGEPVYKNGFGITDGRSVQAVTTESVFGWWSVTKIPTAIAIMQLYERGKLDLDDPVANHLPFFNVIYPESDNEQVTVRQVLNHSSGITEPLAVITWMHPEEEGPYNLTEFVKEKLPQYPELDFEPGAHAQYTNLGYMVLGAVVESVSEMTYEDYVRENILVPLNMKNTEFGLREDMLARLATGSHPLFDFVSLSMPIGWSYMIRNVDLDRRLLWLNRFYAHANPPSGLFGPAYEAAQILRVMLEGGEVDGARILTAESVKTMIEDNHMAYGGEDANPNEVQGLGWSIVTDSDGRIYYEHTGGGVAYHALIRFYPGENLGIVIFLNSTKGEILDMANMISRIGWE